MKKIILIALVAFSITSGAQVYIDRIGFTLESISNIDIGWMKMYKHPAAESYLQLKLRPGFDGRDGETTLETKFPHPAGYSNQTKWFAAPGFSNNKKNNHITITIKKKDETLQVYIDKIKIVEYEKAIPAAHLFNAVSFSSSNSGESDKFYISNIKITMD